MADDLVPDLLARATEELEREFGSLPRLNRRAQAMPTAGAMAAVLEETARRLGDNYPYFHPLVCRADAEAAASGGAGGLCAGDDDQSE